MKQAKKIILSAFLITPLLTPISVLAVANNTPSIGQIPTQVQENRQEIIEDRQENRQEIEDKKAPADAKKKSLINQFKLQVMQKIQNRIRQKLQNRYDRLTKAQTALEAKIQQRASAGVDVSIAEAELAKVSQYQTNYQTQISAYDDIISQMNKSDTPIQFRNQLRQQSKLVNSELVKYGQTLKRTIRF